MHCDNDGSPSMALAKLAIVAASDKLAESKNVKFGIV